MKAALEVDGRLFKLAPITRKAYEKFVGHAVSDDAWRHWKFSTNYHEFSDFTLPMLANGRIVITEQPA